jgi:hypothetical protein
MALDPELLTHEPCKPYLNLSRQGYDTDRNQNHHLWLGLEAFTFYRIMVLPKVEWVLHEAAQQGQPWGSVSVLIRSRSL